jgi:threonine-phosphate decarboxylase
VSVPYLHGGDIHRAAREAGVAPDQILDFSSSINPMGLPARAAERLACEAKDPNTWTRYPDHEAGELRCALSRYAAVPPECLAIAGGADSLIHAAVRAFAPRRCVIPIPAFSEYERACRAAGCEAVFVLRAPDFSLDRGALQLLRRGDLLVLNNPHNPSGACATRVAMRELIDAARAPGASVLIDEAFIDYVPEAAITRQAASMDGIIAIRSLTKFFGCPGLRVGYAAAAPDTIGKIAAQLPPWPVTTLAANAVAEALQDAAYLTEARAQNHRARENLSRALSSLGFRVFPGAANFLLVCVPERTSATETRERLLWEHSILVRECDSFGGLESESYLRIAVRREDENRRLIDALAHILRATSCFQTQS